MRERQRGVDMCSPGLVLAVSMRFLLLADWGRLLMLREPSASREL